MANKNRSLVETHPELVAQWHPTKNSDLTPSDISYDSAVKVWWKCDKGMWPNGSAADDHEWQQSPRGRTHGTLKVTRGCPCCTNRKVVPSNCFATTHPDLAKEWHPTKNGDLTPRDIVAGSKKKVWWKCDKGTWPDGSPADDHEWEATPDSRTRNRNSCPCCSGQKTVPSNCLATTHPDLAKEWHPTKNGDLTPRDVVAGSMKKVWWKCDKGTWPDGSPADDHEWEAVCVSRSRPNAEGHVNGCPCCTNRKVVPSNCLATTHPDLAKEWHPTKNGDLTPWDVTFGTPKSLWWKCNKGTWPDGSPADDHEYKATVYNRANGSGCNCCSGQKTVASNCLATTHPHLIKEWHPTKNGSLTPWDFVACSTQKKIWWKCNKGTWPDGSPADDHEWQTFIASRTFHNNGCPCCSGHKTVHSNCLANTHPHLVKEWHPTKNGKLTPYDIRYGHGSYVWWKCAKGHEWQATPTSRTGIAKAGCPICNESKGEKAIRKYLDERISKKAHDPQHRMGNGQRFDDYVEHTPYGELGIEYQGEGHYQKIARSSSSKNNWNNLMSVIENDHIKLSWCRQHNIHLLLIPYWDYDRIPEILDDVFAGRTPTFSEPPEIVLKNELIRKKIRDRLGITEPEILYGLIKPEAKDEAA